MNSLVYWSAQIVGSILIGGLLLDQSRISRRTRAFAAWAILMVVVIGVNVWAYEYQK